VIKSLVSSSVGLALILSVFGLGYWAKENDVPLPPIVKQYIPESGKAPKAPKVISEQAGIQPTLGEAVVSKYVLPVSISVDQFTRCLESRVHPLYDGRDFYIKEISSIIRIIVPISRDDELSAGYEDCRSRLARR